MGGFGRCQLLSATVFSTDPQKRVPGSYCLKLELASDSNLFDTSCFGLRFIIKLGLSPNLRCGPELRGQGFHKLYGDRHLCPHQLTCTWLVLSADFF